MVSLREQRQKNIEALVAWLRSEFPKIVDRLRQSEVWDEMSENERYELVGRVVYERLKSHIETNFMWSHATVYNYTRTVMFQIGCVFRFHKWFCRLELAKEASL